jgi:hypothetical protein
MDTKMEKPCRACGAALSGGLFCEKCGADQKALAFEAEKAQMLHSEHLKSARTSLMWVAFLSALGAVLSFGRDGGDDMLLLVIGLTCSALYFGLWQWSKKQPLPAAATGLGIYVTLHAANAVADPATLAQGIFVKIAILVMLVRAVRAGVVLRSHGVGAI